MWSELTALQIGKKSFDRIKREWSFGRWMSSDSYENTGSDSNYNVNPISPTDQSDWIMNGNYDEQCCTCHTVNHSATVFFRLMKN